MRSVMRATRAIARTSWTRTARHAGDSPHIVDADDVSPTVDADGNCRRRSFHPVVGRQVEGVADE